MRHTLAYDGFGRKKSVTNSTGLSGLYGYDSLNRVSSINWNGNDGVQAQSISEAITYDSLKDVITGITREAGTFTYGFDQRDRMVSSNYTGSASLPTEIMNRTLALDGVSNRVNDSRNGVGAFLANFPLSNANTLFQPDPEGQGDLVKRTNRSTGIAEDFTYQSDGLMVGISKASETVSYKYDALGRRIAKVVTRGSEVFTQALSYLGTSNQILLGHGGNGDTYLYLRGQDFVGGFTGQGVAGSVNIYNGPASFGFNIPFTTVTQTPEQDAALIARARALRSDFFNGNLVYSLPGFNTKGNGTNCAGFGWSLLQQ